MSKFRRKPIQIEATKYTGERDNIADILRMSNNISILPDCLIIKTLEGSMKASKGDWIIKGIKGEVYPCKPDIFDQIYESVE